MAKKSASPKATEEKKSGNSQAALKAEGNKDTKKASQPKGAAKAEGKKAEPKKAAAKKGSK